MFFGPLPPKGRPKQDNERLRLIYDRAARDMAAQRTWSRKAVECTDFLEGNQWSDKDRAARDADGLPTLTVNKISPLFRLVLGYQQQNRYDLKFLPGNDALSTQDIAEVLGHTTKQIDTAGKLKWKESTVFQDGMRTGRGFLQVRLDFTNNELGEISQTVLDPHTVYPDSEADDYEPKSWGHVTLSRWMSLDEIKLIYGPKVESLLEPYGMGGANMPIFPVDGPIEDDNRPETFFGLDRFFEGSSSFRFGTAQFGLQDFYDSTRKTIRVLAHEHFCLERVKYVVDLNTGERRVLPSDMKLADVQKLLAWAASPVDSTGQPKEVYNVTVRERLERRLYETHVAGDQILYDDVSIYRTPTIVPFFPYFRRGKTMGMVEDLLDPQREINKRRSAEIAIVGTSANSGWIHHEQGLSQEEQENLDENGGKPGLRVRWKGEAHMKPERIQPPTSPVAYEKLEQKATADLKEISGINESALGNIDRVQSGRAIEARQRQAVIALQGYLDNSSRTRELRGEKMLEIIQDHYTEERLVKTIGDDGQPLEMTINQQAADRIVNDVTVGTYMVAIDESPASATFLAGQLEEALEMREKGIPIPNDILVDLSTMPRKREIKQKIAEAEQQQQGTDPQIQKAAIAAAGVVEAARVKAGVDRDLGSMELAIKAEQGAFLPQPAAPSPAPGQGGGGGGPPPAPPAAAAAAPRPSPRRVSPLRKPPGLVNAMQPHAVVPGGGTRPQGHGIAPELPSYGAAS